jgi:hypothetical protein
MLPSYTRNSRACALPANSVINPIEQALAREPARHPFVVAAGHGRVPGGVEAYFTRLAQTHAAVCSGTMASNGYDGYQ